ncbi:hypothetical protein RHS03_06376, partial [Rhizoctonia solani]
MNHARTFLINHHHGKIHITWVPGHNGIIGNEMADRLGNQGANAPPTPIFSRTTAWRDHTNSRINSSYYIPRPPALKLHPIFNESRLGRDIECRLVQFITGQGHYGEYHARFHHDVDPRCACEEWEEIITHLTTSCPATAGHREILRGFSTGVPRSSLFSSHLGLEVVAKFIAETGIGRRRRGPPATAQIL